VAGEEEKRSGQRPQHRSRFSEFDALHAPGPGA
jgi:hypothetical protein